MDSAIEDLYIEQPVILKQWKKEDCVKNLTTASPFIAHTEK